MSKNKNIIPEKYQVKNAIINYYLLLMFTVFPLFVTSQYSNIRHDKFYVFAFLSGLLAVVGIPILIYSAVKDSSPWYKNISLTDWAFAVMILVFTISTLLSPNIFDSFLGISGRFCGLLSFVLFFLVYLVISRNFIYREYVFTIFSIAMLFVCMLCILNTFGIDLFGMYDGYSAEIRKDFVSTIGNRNIMSSLCCLTVPAFFVLFINNKSTLRFLYLLTSVVGLFAMIRCDSMSGYLGIAVAVVFLSLFYAKKSGKKFFLILVSVYSVTAFIFVSLFIYFTFIDTVTPTDSFMKFFRFNEKWGTHRGYMWLKSFELFSKYDIKSILFGCGPDTFYHAFEPYFAELSSRFGDAVNNSAHNEFLNYLITTGVFGLASYLTLIVSSVCRAAKSAVKNPMSLVFITPVISYVFQSFVNVSTVIVLPILFIFISLAENISRKELNAS